MSIEVIIGIIGLFIALAAYIQAQKPQEIKLPEPKEEMDNLKAHFLMNQKLSIEIQNLLEKYIIENQADEKLFFENMTFSKYLNFVKSEHENCLSEKIYQTLSEPIYTRSNIESMLTSLHNQNTNLMMVKNMIKSLV
jgi:hypothetical protein